MSDDYSYPGQELHLFRQARNWKNYFAALMRPYLKGDVAEVGAGTGNTTIYLNNGSNASSWLLLEPDSEFCKLIEADIASGTLPANCRVMTGNIHSLSHTALFDAIVYIDVLEHIEADRKEIDAAIGHLKTGGHLVILSPAYPSLYSPFDKAIGHYRRYTRRSLTGIIDKKQMKPVRLGYLDSVGSILSWANSRLAKRSHPTANQIAFWDRVLVPLSRIIDRIVCYTFGRSILGIWKKNEATS